MNGKVTILTFEYYDITIKEVRKQIDEVLKMAVYGADQTTMTMERSTDKCGRYNMVIFVSADHRLKAEDIARLYQYLAQGLTPNKLVINHEEIKEE